MTQLKQPQKQFLDENPYVGIVTTLRKDGSPLCLESTFTNLDEVKNDGTQFKAKH